MDSNGVHSIKVHCCRCPNARSDDIQYMMMGLFPASFKEVKTAFTFRLLDDFRADNLECKTSALGFWRRIVRLTCSAFPKTVPVSQVPDPTVLQKRADTTIQNRYRELMRVSRQWRNLKYLKWHGFGHKTSETPGSGGLALFCAACPQPGVNLPEDWEKDEDQ